MQEIEDLFDSSEVESPEFPGDDLHASSWFMESGTTAIKKTDRHAFLYRETVIPQKLREFFSLEDLRPGQKRRITLWFGNTPYEASVEKTVHNPPRTRMLWKQDFAAVLRAEYPELQELFKKTRKDSGDTPAIGFVKREKADHYDIELDGIPSAVAAAGAPGPKIPINPGDVIDNETLVAIFRCSPEGAMRRSFRSGSLVLVSDHTKAVFEDTWVNNFFHFTGTGSGREQDLSSREYKILRESKTNGASLHLFEVFEEGNYGYIGEVELADPPFRSRQPDREKNPRDVTIFPLKLKGRKRPPVLKQELLETINEHPRKNIHPVSVREPAFPEGPPHAGTGSHRTIPPAIERDGSVSGHAKRRANGICQLCERPAPFRDSNGEPFLEIHHIIGLEEGGKDVIGNTVALCPNCHRKMHVLDLPEDVAALKKSGSR